MRIFGGVTIAAIWLALETADPTGLRTARRALLSTVGSASYVALSFVVRTSLLLLLSACRYLLSVLATVLVLVLSTVADVLGAQAALTTATATTAEAVAAISQLPAKFQAELYAAAARLIPAVVVIAALGLCILWGRCALKSRRRRTYARRHLSHSAWLSLPTKVPLAPLHLVSTLGSSEGGDVPVAADATLTAEDAAAAVRGLEQLEAWRERTRLVACDHAASPAAVGSARTTIGRYCRLATEGRTHPLLARLEMKRRGVVCRYSAAWGAAGWSVSGWLWGLGTCFLGFGGGSGGGATADSHGEADWDFEAASAAYNLAAALSQLAPTQPLDARCASYRQAAGALQTVAAMARFGLWAPPLDMSADTLGAGVALMLAQAQRCVYEKAIERGLGPPTLEALSSECGSLYEEAAELITSTRGKPFCFLSAEWAEAPRRLASLFAAKAQTHAAAAHASALEYGKQVSRLQCATRLCAEAAHGAPPPLRPHLEHEAAMASAAAEEALKDNETIYFEAVPPVESLPPCRRASGPAALVAPATPPELQQSGGGAGGSASSPGTMGSPFQALEGAVGWRRDA